MQHAESDAWLSMGLAFYLNVLPLSRQLASLSGALWTRVLQVSMLQPHKYAAWVMLTCWTTSSESMKATVCGGPQLHADALTACPYTAVVHHAMVTHSLPD